MTTDTNDTMRALDALMQEQGVGQTLGMMAAVLTTRAERRHFQDAQPVNDLAGMLSDMALADAVLATDMQL